MPTVETIILDEEDVAALVNGQEIRRGLARVVCTGLAIKKLKSIIDLAVDDADEIDDKRWKAVKEDAKFEY